MVNTEAPTSAVLAEVVPVSFTAIAETVIVTVAVVVCPLASVAV